MPEKPPKSKPDRLRISTVAERAGVSTQTVEYYIMLGLLKCRRAPKTRRRIFTEAHIKRIALIRELNRSGYTLGEIREIWLKNKEI